MKHCVTCPKTHLVSTNKPEEVNGLQEAFPQYPDMEYNGQSGCIVPDSLETSLHLVWYLHVVNAYIIYPLETIM